MGLIGATLSFIILISVLVGVHELGHLIAARANGVFVEVFSIGFGPVLCEFTDKKGTKWRISLIPIGGYVKMFGDADASSVKETCHAGYTEEDMDRMSIHRKKPWQKLIVAACGPIANFILAIFVLILLATIKGVPEYTPVISPSGEDSIAYKAGVRDGDVVLKANEKDVKSFNDIVLAVRSSTGKDLSFELKTSTNQIKQIKIKMYKEEAGKIIPVKTIGISPKETVYKRVSFVEAICSAVTTTYSIAYNNINGIIQMITNKAETKNIGGIISIFKMSAESAENGIATFSWMLAMLSVILGAINLLPIPVLDGGTVIISAIEWIIGKPLNKKFVESIFMVGLVAVASLMLLGIWNDLSKCKFFVFVENLFK